MEEQIYGGLIWGSKAYDFMILYVRSWRDRRKCIRNYHSMPTVPIRTTSRRWRISCGRHVERAASYIPALRGILPFPSPLYHHQKAEVEKTQSAHQR